ncbi:MAG TPA: VanZ family protein [Psychromonas sp.]
MIILLTMMRNYWLACTVFTLSVITLLSLNPMGELPSVPGGDKIHHFIAYAILMFPVALKKPKHWLFMGLLFLCLSGGIELLQPLAGRHSDWFDISANWTGIMFSILLAQLIHRGFPSSLNQDR